MDYAKTACSRGCPLWRRIIWKLRVLQHPGSPIWQIEFEPKFSLGQNRTRQHVTIDADLLIQPIKSRNSNFFIYIRHAVWQGQRFDPQTLNYLRASWLSLYNQQVTIDFIPFRLYVTCQGLTPFSWIVPLHH